jgi:hypothetical protein
MLTKTITYHDLDGNEFTEDFYFNFSKAEIVEQELIHHEGGGFGAYLTMVTSSGNGSLIMSTFKDIISNSYGRRSADGKSFLKNKEDREAFLGSEAYEKLFLELITEPNAAAQFVNGLLPADAQAAAKEQAAKPGFRPGAETLPKSRRDQLEAERQSDGQNTNPSPPVQVAPEPAPQPLNQDEIEQIRRQARLDFEAEQLQAKQNPATVDPSTQPWNGVDGLPPQ